MFGVRNFLEQNIYRRGCIMQDLDNDMITRFNNLYNYHKQEDADYLYDVYFNYVDIERQILILKYTSNRNHMSEIENSDPVIRKTIAQYGTNENRLMLINDKSANVRSAVAQYCDDKMRELLKDDKSKRVLAKIYKYTKSDELRNYVFAKNKICPSMIGSVLSSNTTNKKHIVKSKMYKK